jgi:hypothetical protein
MLEGYPDVARKLRDMVADRVEDWTRDLGNLTTVIKEIK